MVLEADTQSLCQDQMVPSEAGAANTFHTRRRHQDQFYKAAQEKMDLEGRSITLQGRDPDLHQGGDHSMASRDDHESSKPDGG